MAETAASSPVLDQGSPQGEACRQSFMYGFVLLTQDEIFTHIRVNDGYLECILPDGEFDALGEKQCEKLNATPTGPPVIVLGNGYPGWIYTLIGACKSQATWLYQGPKNKKDCMLIKKLPLRTKVFTLKMSFGPGSVYKLFAESIAGGDVNANGWQFGIDVKVMPNHIAQLIEEALEEQGQPLGPNVTIKLVGKGNNIIPTRCPLWDPRMISRPQPRLRLLSKQSVQKMHLKKLVDFH